MDRRTERRNGNLYLWANLLIYLAAPVYYVGVVQAALCAKLGASATVANLPSVGFFLTSFTPVVFACLTPHRWERGMLVLTGYLAAVLVALVAAALCMPFGNEVQIGLVVGQAFILGILTSVNQLFQTQCLGRGTTDWGRSRALKLTYTFGPIAAVAGSGLAQFILRGGIPFLAFPRDFAMLYVIAIPCSAIGAWCCSRMDLLPLADEPQVRFFRSLLEGLRRYTHSSSMLRLWFAYALWYSAILALANFSLLTRHAMGREPAEFSGIITAIQFGSKAVAGYGLGALYLRRGIRAPVIACVLFLALAMVWGWNVPGYFFLATFGLMGAGELGGVYFPNVILSWSPSKTATQDLAVLGLATVLASPAPAIYGMLTDRWGFSASFILGLFFALSALALVFRLPIHLRPKSSAEISGSVISGHEK